MPSLSTLTVTLPKATAESYRLVFDTYANTKGNYSNTATNLESFNTGWYLPSIAELFQIYAKGMGADKVIDLNAAILALGGDGLETCWYLTSNQFTENQIYQLALSDGSWNYQVKEMNNFSAACCIDIYSSINISLIFQKLLQYKYYMRFTE